MQHQNTHAGIDKKNDFYQSFDGGLVGGSEASAAGGGRSEMSEWQRSTDGKALRRRSQMSGTATGLGEGGSKAGINAGLLTQ